MKIRISIFIILTAMVNCAGLTKMSSGSGSSEIVKKNGYKADIRKVSVASVYSTEKKTLGDRADISIISYSGTVDGRAGEIFGDSFAGGDALDKLAAKLKITGFQDALKNLAESELGNESLRPETSKNLSTLIEKGKIDAIVLPFVTGGLDSIMTGKDVKFGLIVFNGKTSSSQIFALGNRIAVSPEEKKLAETSPDRAKAAVNASAMKNANELLDRLKKEVKNVQDVGPSAKQDDKLADNKETKKEEVSSSETAEEKKEPEVPKTAFERIYPPALFGFTALLWLIL